MPDLARKRGFPSPRSGSLFRVLVALLALGVGFVVAPRRRPADLPRATPFVYGDRITVVIGTVGRPSLRHTVTAVLNQTYEAVDVVVVDNAPGSGRVDAALDGIDDPRCVVVREPKRGVSAARNSGVAHAAAGVVVAFTDDDAEPDENWLANLAEVYAADVEGDVMGVTGRVVGLNVDTEDQRWFEESGIFEKGGRRLVWTLNEDVSPDLGERGDAPLFPYTAGEMGSGNNMSLRRSAFELLGGFDERLGAGTPTKGGEDLDMFRRVVLRKGTIVYTPHAIMGHHHRGGRDELRQQMFGYGSGLSAVITKLVLDGGAPAVALLRRVPTGTKMLLAPQQNRFSDEAPAMPLDLKWLELLGFACGPYLWIRSVTTDRGTNS